MPESSPRLAQGLNRRSVALKSLRALLRCGRRAEGLRRRGDRFLGARVVYDVFMPSSTAADAPSWLAAASALLVAAAAASCQPFGSGEGASGAAPGLPEGGTANDGAVLPATFCGTHGDSVHCEDFDGPAPLERYSRERGAEGEIIVGTGTGWNGSSALVARLAAPRQAQPAALRRTIQLGTPPAIVLALACRLEVGSFPAKPNTSSQVCAASWAGIRMFTSVQRDTGGGLLVVAGVNDGSSTSAYLANALAPREPIEVGIEVRWEATEDDAVSTRTTIGATSRTGRSSYPRPAQLDVVSGIVNAIGSPTEDDWSVTIDNVRLTAQ
jgi:hypothetical protein